MIQVAYDGKNEINCELRELNFRQLVLPWDVPLGIPGGKPIVEIQENMDDGVNAIHEANAWPQSVVTGVIR